MKVLGFLAALFLISILATTAIAQETPPPVCESAAFDETMTIQTVDLTMRTALANIQATMLEKVKAGDMAGYLETAEILQYVMSIFDAKCRGLSWTGAEEGQQAVIGPVSFPNGIWRVHMSAMGPYTSAKVTTISGTCDGSIILFMISGGTEGEMSPEKETTFKTQDCTALIEVSSTGSEWDWNLYFELVAAAQ